jgi:hypothetical protein
MLTARADLRHWIENALHRTLAQRRIAIECGRDRAARHRPHDQTATGARIAKIEGRGGLAVAAGPHAEDFPGPLAHPLDPGPERRHGLAGVDDVLALEQAGNAGLADRERPRIRAR